MNHLLKLNPIFRETLWGGHWLGDEFGYILPSRKTGECWAISAHPDGDCIISQGQFKGQTLSSVFAAHKELFAHDARTRFPLLVKLIDAHQDLSVQVHPGDSYAQAHENQPGKTEAWIVLHAQENSQIELGHTAKTKEALNAMVAHKQWDQLLSYRSVTKDDAILVPAGTVHALCQDIAVLEVQQSSDVTYRLYDYDRVDAKGLPRELHIQKALDVIQAPDQSLPSSPIDWTKTHHAITPVLDCPYFKISALTVDGSFSLMNPRQNYFLVSVLSGHGKLNRYQVAKGDHFIVTSLCEKMHFTGRLKMIIVDPLVEGLPLRGGLNRGL